jgi:hypothetical protein
VCNGLTVVMVGLPVLPAAPYWIGLVGVPIMVAGVIGAGVGVARAAVLARRDFDLPVTTSVLGLVAATTWLSAPFLGLLAWALINTKPSLGWLLPCSPVWIAWLLSLLWLTAGQWTIGGRIAAARVAVAAVPGIVVVPVMIGVADAAPARSNGVVVLIVAAIGTALMLLTLWAVVAVFEAALFRHVGTNGTPFAQAAPVAGSTTATPIATDE